MKKQLIVIATFLVALNGVIYGAEKPKLEKAKEENAREEKFREEKLREERFAREAHRDLCVQDPCIPETCIQDDCCCMGYGDDRERGEYCNYFGIELLLFKPTIDQASFVIESSENSIGDEHFPSGKRHLNKSTYEPGVRLEAIHYFCCDRAISLRGTFFDTAAGTSVRGDFLYDTIGFPGSGAQDPEDNFYSGAAHIKDNYQYCAVDFTFNRASVCSCIDNLSYMVGLHFARIHHSTRFTSVGEFDDSTPVSNHLSSKSRFWGVGPELGIDYNYALTSEDCFFGAIDLDFNVRGALLCTKTKAFFHYDSRRTAGTVGVNLVNDDLWRVLPFVDARIEADYYFSFKCWDIMLALGYEWIWYADSVDSIRGIDVAFAGDTIDVFSNFSLQGPYIKLVVGF